MEMWYQDYVDLVTEGTFTFSKEGARAYAEISGDGRVTVCIQFSEGAEGGSLCPPLSQQQVESRRR